MGQLKRWGITTTIGSLAILLALSACASKEEVAAYRQFSKESSRLSLLQQSEKLIFRPGDANETIVLVHYLPTDDGEVEHLILAGNPSERFNDAAFRSSRLSGKEPLTVTKVSRGSLEESLQRVIPRWFSIYSVEYPGTTSSKFPLTLTIGKETKSVYFYKKPKYLINKKSFKSF